MTESHPSHPSRCPASGEAPVDVHRCSGITRLKNLIKRHSLPYRLAILAKALPHGLMGLMRGKRGSWDHIRSTLSFVIRSNRISGRPINVTLEPINICNLRCAVCETGAGILQRAQRPMAIDDYKTIIDKVAEHTNTIQFYFMGEPFIHRQSYEMIRYAKSKGVPFITTCTNGEAVLPAELIESGIDEVNFQIGGMTQTTHATYRTGGNLERTLHNLSETIRLRRERGLTRPHIVCGFILMKHNEHEVPAFRETMSQMGVDHAWVIEPCVRTIEQGREMLPTDKNYWFYDPESFERGVLRPRILLDNECPWIYYNMAIHVNGDVVPCCRDNQGTEVMGNLVKQSLEEIWNSPRYVEFRRRIHTDQGQVAICRLCSSFGSSPLN